MARDTETDRRRMPAWLSVAGALAAAAGLAWTLAGDLTSKGFTRAAPGNEPDAPATNRTDLPLVLPAGELLVDESMSAAQDDVSTYVFRLRAASQVKLSVELGEKVPVNIVALAGRVRGTDYLMALGSVLARQETQSLEQLFASPLSKRSATGSFDSPWVRLEPGTHTIVFDNSGQLSPAWDDVPLRLRLVARRSP